MNTAVGAFARISLLLCAGFASSALAQGDTQSNSSALCTKTRCFTPSCYRQYAGGYYMSCPDGKHPLPKSEQTVPTEADRNEQAELKPFFNPKAEDAVNYGGIGAVIGHEISHGFDDQGSQYDGNGNLPSDTDDPSLPKVNCAKSSQIVVQLR
jgi:hypothetical protein